MNSREYIVECERVPEPVRRIQELSGRHQVAHPVLSSW